MIFFKNILLASVRHHPYRLLDSDFSGIELILIFICLISGQSIIVLFHLLHRILSTR